MSGSDPIRSNGDGSDPSNPEGGGALATTRPAESKGFDTDRTPPALPTTMLERYEIKRLIGTGGMGAVYEALDRNLHRIVALKVLKLVDEDPSRVAEAANRLVREARAMAVLSHRGVVTVYDVGVSGSQVYVAMQLVDGTTLRAWLAAAPRTVSEILRVLCEAGQGLAAAHSARLVHRDFKPDNVLISRRGTARVTDFGLARRATFEADESEQERASHPRVLDVVDNDNVTRSGAVLGTPAYMAPEQTEGRPCDARADQFAFCVTAWEALYAKRPFAGATWSEIYGNILTHTITAPDLGMRVPRTIERALRRGLSVDPADRFTTMDELLAILATGVERRRSWMRLAAIGVASAAIAVPITWIVKDREPAQPPAPAAPAAPAPVLAPPLDPPRAPPPLASPPPSIVKVRPHVDRGPQPPNPASEPKVTTQAPKPATSEEPEPPVAPPSADPGELDHLRAQRSAFYGDAARRGLRPTDWPSDVASELAECDRALTAGEVARGQTALDNARRALAAVVIDRRFVDAKLARFNKTGRVPAGREAEFRELFAKLKSLVERGQFDQANAVLNDLHDRVPK